MGGAVGAARGVGRVEGTTWGTVKVMGAARGAVEVGEACDEGAAQGQAVRPPTFVRGAV
jgi:hypothetical protein